MERRSRAGTLFALAAVVGLTGGVCGGDSNVDPPTPPDNVRPSANFTVIPAEPEPGETVSFNGTGSSDSDGTIESYDWDFGDGSSAAGSEVTHTFAVEGDYTVTLRVTDDDGATGTTTQTVSVRQGENDPPDASFTHTPTQPEPAETVSFDASGSSDPDGTIESYDWDFGDGSSAAGSEVTHAYSQEGDFTVALTVTDDDGASDRTTQTVSASTASSGDWNGINAGAFHACAISSEGTPYCWGSDEEGQVGDGGDAGGHVLTPVAVAGGLTVQDMSASDYRHSAAVATNPDGWTWGRNQTGQLGDGSREQRNTPVQVAGGHSFTDIAAGADFSCAVTEAAEIYCWGMNDDGQLGDGTTRPDTRPRPLAHQADLGWAAVTAGNGHACALDDFGQASCWGANHDGQLGDGTTETDSVPVLVDGSHEFGQISAGDLHTCAVAGGTAYCWGSNSHGQLGDGTFTDRTTPTEVNLDASLDVVRVSAGYAHSCAVASDGTAYCWGDDEFGQLGHGAIGGQHPDPVEVTGGHVWSVVDAGQGFTCGIDADGAAWCWGSNDSGKLGTGDDTATTHDEPARVADPGS